MSTTPIIVHNDIKEILCQIFAPLNLILWVVIVIYHIISIKKFDFTGGTKPKSVYVTFALILFALIILLGLFFQIYVVSETNIYCEITQFTGMTSYAFFKTILYLLLIFRLHESFRNSSLAYSNKTLLIWASVLVSWNILNIILGLTTTKIYLDLNSVPTCVVEFEMFTPALWILLDITACVVNSYLFVRPIIELKKTLTGDSTNLVALELQLVAVKQCILSMTATIGTVCTMILIALMELSPVFVGFDTNVSTLCIILMYKWNSVLVGKICGCCLKPIEDVANLEMTVNANSAPRHLRRVISNTNSIKSKDKSKEPKKSKEKCEGSKKSDHEESRDHSNEITVNMPQSGNQAVIH